VLKGWKFEYALSRKTKACFFDTLTRQEWRRIKQQVLKFCSPKTGHQLLSSLKSWDDDGKPQSTTRLDGFPARF